MGRLESYRDLEVWKVSMRLARAVYQATEVMPKHEIYGLTSQILETLLLLTNSLNYSFPPLAQTIVRSGKPCFIKS
ncbi:MAG: four helix bundle protein [Leptolyngbyaceae cyanobacterium SM1_4_3]|nr:four helix bundle protein [Leptolyngbyaceae cyanobacterium SM1_4_3]